jgi:hypothetical protein
VALVVTSRRARLLDAQVPLTADCIYSRTIRVPRGRRTLVATARFGGNAVLTSASSERRSFR